MKKYFFVILLIILTTKVSASNEKKIIENLKNINNISFNFEQNINGKIENGNCTIQYPKRIFCKYKLKNQKVLVSDGKFLVIKTKTSYYLYPLKKTPLNLILDKKFLLNKISEIKGRNVDDKYINFNFIENENEINIFFDKQNYNLIGWQTLDIYQNLSIIYLSALTKNKILDKNLFELPKRN